MTRMNNLHQKKTYGSCKYVSKWQLDQRKLQDFKRVDNTITAYLPSLIEEFSPKSQYISCIHIYFNAKVAWREGTTYHKVLRLR